MLTESQFRRIFRAFPLLQQADQKVIEEFQASAYFARIPAGKDVFVEGDDTDAIALLISGVVRVYKIGETGREITLYRFGHGESCILTANAILSTKSFPAIATVETDAEAVMVPAATFRQWVNQSEIWRTFVFGLLSDRLSTVMAVVDEVAFQRLDKRVAAWILNKAGASREIKVTHQQIAAELGSSREVISRILEDFSQLGIIQSRRGMIAIADMAALENRAVM